MTLLTLIGFCLTIRVYSTPIIPKTKEPPLSEYTPMRDQRMHRACCVRFIDQGATKRGRGRKRVGTVKAISKNKIGHVVKQSNATLRKFLQLVKLFTFNQLQQSSRYNQSERLSTATKLRSDVQRYEKGSKFEHLLNLLSFNHSSSNVSRSEISQDDNVYVKGHFYLSVPKFNNLLESLSSDNDILSHAGRISVEETENVAKSKNTNTETMENFQSLASNGTLPRLPQGDEYGREGNTSRHATSPSDKSEDDVKNEVNVTSPNPVKPVKPLNMTSLSISHDKEETNTNSTVAMVLNHAVTVNHENNENKTNVTNSTVGQFYNIEKNENKTNGTNYTASSRSTQFKNIEKAENKTNVTNSTAGQFYNIEKKKGITKDGNNTNENEDKTSGIDIEELLKSLTTNESLERLQDTGEFGISKENNYSSILQFLQLIKLLTLNDDVGNNTVDSRSNRTTFSEVDKIPISNGASESYKEDESVLDAAPEDPSTSQQHKSIDLSIGLHKEEGRGENATESNTNKQDRMSVIVKFEQLLKLMRSKQISNDKDWKDNTYLHLSIAKFEDLLNSLMYKASSSGGAPHEVHQGALQEVHQGVPHEVHHQNNELVNKKQHNLKTQINITNHKDGKPLKLPYVDDSSELEDLVKHLSHTKKEASKESSKNGKSVHNNNKSKEYGNIHHSYPVPPSSPSLPHSQMKINEINNNNYGRKHNSTVLKFRKLLQLITFRNLIQGLPRIHRREGASKPADYVRLNTEFIGKIDKLLKLLAFNRIFEDMPPKYP